MATPTPQNRPPVVVVTGPTASGKTALAVELAKRFGGEIVNADSMQVYRYMDIGTAKPSVEVRASIPHHLIDVVDPDDPMSAGRYAGLARQAAREVQARGRPVILCGGTGLYARAFAGGLVAEVESDGRVRAELELRETDDLYAELRAADPASAERIRPADRVRIVRALEVWLLGGRSMSEQHACHRFSDRPFAVTWLGLDVEREQLGRRIAERVDRMFRDGLVEEVRGLYRSGYGPDLRCLQSIGYREVGLHLADRMTEAETRVAITHATRRYAKRQRTWFRAEPGLEWIDAEARERAVQAGVEALG